MGSPSTKGLFGVGQKSLILHIPKLSKHHGSLCGSKLGVVNARRIQFILLVLSNAPFCDVLSDVLPNTRRIIANNKTW